MSMGIFLKAFLLKSLQNTRLTAFKRGRNIMLLYNSLTRNKDEFKPRFDNKVSMYTCGPTVYHFAHIGNLRTYAMEDVLEKYLSHLILSGC